MKLYYDANDKFEGYAYTLSHYKARLMAENKSHFDLIEAVKYKDNDVLRCEHYDTTIERGECGRCCEFYVPQNGKSGCCKHVGTMYEQSDERFTLRSNP